jgi:ribose transport system substrate-binding protein
MNKRWQLWIVVCVVLAMAAACVPATAPAPAAPTSAPQQQPAAQPQPTEAAPAAPAAPATAAPAAATPAAGGKQPHFVFVTPLMANPYWDVVEQGWKDGAAKFNAQVDYIGPTALSLDEMIKYMETAIAQKVDGIATMALNADAMKKPIADAKAAGIPVVLVDTDAPDSQRDAYAGTSNEAAGEAAGDFMTKVTGGKATIAILTGRLDQPNLVARVDGFNKVIAKSPNMKVVDMQPDDSDLQKGIQAAEAMLLAHPDITAMFGSEGFGAPALCTVVKEAGKSGQIHIVGFDDLTQSVDCIKAGTVDGVVVQKQYVMGYRAVEYLTKLINKQTVASVTDTGVIMLTKDNVATYKDETLNVN